MIRLADYVFSELQSNYGLSHVFMVTGRGALFLTDAVAANKYITPVCMHHEQGAAFAAVAYAQQSDQLGACLVSTGCASTNAVTGVLNAWQDGLPVIFISGQNKLNETSRHTGIPLRTYGQQEADIVSLVSGITKYATMITDPTRIGYELGKALYLANEGRKGPVWLDIPLDVQNMRVNPTNLELFVQESAKSHDCSSEDVEYVANELSRAERPVLLIGHGIRSANAESELEELASMLQIPVTYSGSSPDIYPLEKELSIGSVGIMGCSRAGNFAVQNSDLLLVLGSRLSTMTTDSDKCKFARSSNVIVVDIDEVEHSKDIIRVDRFIKSDVRVFINRLKERKLQEISAAWKEKCFYWKSIFPKFEQSFLNPEKVDIYNLTKVLSDTLPEDASVVTDSGLIELILPTNLNFRNNRRCIHPASQGSMGYALPAVVGAYFSSGGPVISVVGDGSIMMNLQELQTISFLNIPAKIFVINNNAYAIIRKRQKDLFRRRTIGTDPQDGVGCPNFSKVADAFEFKFKKIEDAHNLEENISDVLNTEGPVLCEVIGYEDQDYITTSYAKTESKRFAYRPLEDQAPFLDRELFLKEMIIEPIDQ